MKKIYKNLTLISGISLMLFLLFYGAGIAQDDREDGEFVPDPELFPFAKENENCLKCHAEDYFNLVDPETGVEKKRIMNRHYRFSREDFYNANHKTFACLDCHDYGYEEFPHPIEARLEEPYACIDCHGYDENWAQYHFEEIEEEYQSSVHSEIEYFSCWKCHDAHTYKINVRNSTNLEKTIQYDNNICLECHGNMENFLMLTSREEMNVVDTHDWLPNQVAHFASVRCIECHTAINDSILVAHNVRPKEEAVKNCVECHTSNSRLMQTLYKFESKKNRKNGYVNAVILNESYVIGANQNIILNIGSLLILGFILLIIFVHIAFRVTAKKKQ